MPTYGYQCKSCSFEFEEFQTISEEPLKECPSCKKPTLIRIIGGGAGLHFKGSGFYLTDYKKTSTGGGEKTETPKKTTDTPAAPKTESKPSDTSSTKSSGESKS